MNEHLPGLLIGFPLDGTVLTSGDGVAVGDALRVRLEGSASCPGVLTVDGTSHRLVQGSFRLPLDIEEHRTDVRLAWKSERGEGQETLRILRDRSPKLRYRFSVDDNILFLRDIARQHPKSLFQNPFLAFWRRMHERYGTKVHFNLYYRHKEFKLSQMPDTYTKEWEDQREWIRLTFHALQDEPARPYLGSNGDRMERDFLRVTREIERWASPRLLSPFTTVHWGEATREGCRALRRNGIRGLVGYFTFQGGRPFCSYYLDSATVRHLEGREAWMDWEEDLLFVKHDVVVNQWDKAELERRLKALGASPREGRVLELMVHEQYFRKDLPRFYQRDIEQRVERAIQWASERDYLPVFYEQGFLGARQ